MKQEARFEEISRRLFSTLKNTEIQNPQLIISFSGIPGAGKSRLAKQLEERYHAVRVGNDAIRRIIFGSEALFVSEPDAELLLQDYNEHFLRRYPFRNRLLIFDKSMDRQYKRFFPIFEELGLEYFIIRLGINKEDAINRILDREEIDESSLRQNMERWQREFQDFGRNAHYDVLLHGLNPDLDYTYKGIDRLLNSQAKDQ